MSTKVKYRQLVEKLFQNTSSGKIRWEKLEGAEIYKAAVGIRSIVIGRAENFMGEPIIEIGILDELDTEVETFNDENVKGAIPSITGYDGYWPLMSELHEMARRQAVGADKVLDGILGDLS